MINMDQKASIMLHDAQKLIKIERWARRFAWLTLVWLILSLLSFVLVFENALSSVEGFDLLEAFYVFSEVVNLWDKSRILVSTIDAIFGFLAIYLLLQGLSKIIHYLLNLKSLALKRYTLRKIPGNS
jgi:hypothetical protein